ncbi:hypothetical protein [Rhodococcus sp. 14-2483-1-2]|uniref:hypothetical protein n=1 Tax=Rhodococcus sp. 14-2483-1-2 TaxID=2023147 RepID=UPI00148248F2|nr:hypothetical protein [Rhodococcus sp. 14-2483-1-2]
MWLIVYIAFLLWLVVSTMLAVSVGTAISRSSPEGEAAEMPRRSGKPPKRTDTAAT